jgi:hypothetical protein
VPSESLTWLLALFNGGLHAALEPPLDALRFAPHALSKPLGAVLEMIANLFGFCF